MMRRITLTVFVWALTAAAVLAQDRTVRDIRFRNRGAGSIDESFLRAHIQTEVGEELDHITINNDVRGLLETEALAYVGVELESAEDGVVVVYVVENRLTLAEPPVIEGNDHFRASTLRDWLEVNVGDLVDEQVVGVGVSRILNEYRKDHYPRADVTWDLNRLEADPTRAVLRMVIEEGPRARMTGVAFDGNEHIERSELRRAMGFRAFWNPIRWFSKRRYDPEEHRLYLPHFRSRTYEKTRYVFYNSVRLIARSAF